MGTILLVDDNPLRASMRKSLLDGSAPRVVRAVNPSEALCLVESPDFASTLLLIVTEHHTQGIAGPDFVEELRRRLPEIPLLVLDSPSSSSETYESIPGVYLSQTSLPLELRALVNRLIGLGERRYA